LSITLLSGLSANKVEAFELVLLRYEGKAYCLRQRHFWNNKCTATELLRLGWVSCILGWVKLGQEIWTHVHLSLIPGSQKQPDIGLVEKWTNLHSASRFNFRKLGKEW